jgi:hypothetical protein
MPYQNTILNRRKQQETTKKKRKKHIDRNSRKTNNSCRAVRIGNIIEVSGTVAIVDGEK